VLLEEMKSENFEEMVKQGAAGRREVRRANKYILVYYRNYYSFEIRNTVLNRKGI